MGSGSMTRLEAQGHSVRVAEALAAEFTSRGVSFRELLGFNSNQLRGVEVMDADGYVL